jgi:pyruvate dehydrogenase E1 component beta subunit
VRRGTFATLGQAEIVRPGHDITIAATLLMVDRALAAAEALQKRGVDTEVIDVRWLRPLDHQTVAGSFERTGRLLLVEEEVHQAGWAATIVSELARGHDLVGRVGVISLPDDLLLPYSPTLEDRVIPSVDSIVTAAASLVEN